MTEHEARIAFNLIPGLGSVKAEALVRETNGDFVDAYQRLPNKRNWQGETPNWQREIEQAANSHVTILTACSADWPTRLNDLASPPLALYVVGDVKALSKRGVALVGTRRATRYGKDTAERLAFELAQAGWGVYSGLALGIDAASHHGALTGDGVTVGILGGALDKFYPDQNRALAHEMIEKGGAVASEFPFGRAPDHTSFPQRNRLVAALAQGVVAVEAPSKSGTLITCNQAAEMGRCVMAVPGRVGDAYSVGCLQLLHDGAVLVRDAGDIIDALNPLLQTQPKRKNVSKSQVDTPRKKNVTVAKKEETNTRTEETCALTAEERDVLRALKPEGVTIDQIAQATKLTAARINVVLVGLRLKQRAKFLPGGRVATR